MTIVGVIFMLDFRQVDSRSRVYRTLQSVTLIAGVFVDLNQFHDYDPKPLPEEIDPITSPQVILKGDEGTMIIFPSWLPHKVPRNNSDRDRVSASFNAVLTTR